MLAEIFKTQGFDTKLGPGSNDGGVDITLIQCSPLGDIATVVQVKKHSQKNKIGLTEVQALYGAQSADRVQKALFITTSTYAPVAARFAARENVQMQLATSSEVSDWCQVASHGIIEDKSSLVTRDRALKIISEIGVRVDRRIVHANSGYNQILNEFALIIKESKHAVLLLKLSRKTISDDGYGQAGMEIPNLDPLLPNFHSNGVVRARRDQNIEGNISYWDGYHFYSPWDGNACHFDRSD